MTLLELGDVDGAERWLGLAATAASMRPVASRSRQLETWRGMARAGAGDAEGMRRHLERAVAMATEERPGVGAVRGPGPPRPRGGAVWTALGDRDGGRLRTRRWSSSSSDRRRR